MCTSLAPEIGYDAAAAIAKTAYKTGKNVRDVAYDLAGKSAADAASSLGLSTPLRQDVPSKAAIDQILDARSQTVRGTGVGRAAGG
jgi:fumarate hydratase class II